MVKTIKRHKSLKEPIKRHIGMQPISREHHVGLLLCWKIKEGLKKNIEVKRIKEYVDCVFEKNLIPHMDFEEEHVYPLLPDNHLSIKRAKREHAKLRGLFQKEEDIEKNLYLIDDLLIAHIRFEERILFQEIQKAATEEQLLNLARLHIVVPEMEWHDEFWL